jgi:cytoskeletal protein CcmA (bactofilin family)
MAWPKKKSTTETLSNPTNTSPSQPTPSPEHKPAPVTPVATPSLRTGTDRTSPELTLGRNRASTARAVIGKSVCISGELSGDEDLLIEGKVDGRVALTDHCLTVGANGRVNADVHAKQIVVIGEIIGNISAVDLVEVAATGTVHGDISARRVVLADGAHFKGSVDMQPGLAPSATPTSTHTPTSTPTTTATSTTTPTSTPTSTPTTTPTTTTPPTHPSPSVDGPKSLVTSRDPVRNPATF